jgi:hypothetical protein
MKKTFFGLALSSVLYALCNFAEAQQSKKTRLLSEELAGPSGQERDQDRRLLATSSRSW